MKLKDRYILKISKEVNAYGKNRYELSLNGIVLSIGSAEEKEIPKLFIPYSPFIIKYVESL